MTVNNSIRPINILRWIYSAGVIVLIAMCGTTMGQTNIDTQSYPYPEPVGVLDTPLSYSGWRGKTTSASHLREIRIGLFSPLDTDNRLGIAVRHAAEMAISEANDQGGISGIPLKLVHRWRNDPWGSGTKEMIKLIYQDSVWAVIGSINGAATHIAEQIATKARIPLISPISSDPTLNYIRIPWIFRLPPDDEDQANILVQNGIRQMNLQSMGLITATDHDGRIFAGEMRAAFFRNDLIPAFQFEVPAADINYEDIVHRALSFSPGGIVIRLPEAALRSLLYQFQKAGYAGVILLPWIPGLQERTLRDYFRGLICYIKPFTADAGSAQISFSGHYAERFKELPPPGATYTYDAMQIVIQALRRSGLNRSALRDAIAGMNIFPGVTGPIHWDNGGGNPGEPTLVILPGE